jgi:hypothetical protein
MIWDWITYGTLKQSEFTIIFSVVTFNNSGCTYIFSAVTLKAFKRTFKI